MQCSLFGYLSRLPDLSLFLIGCCVHCVDLLSEDASKLPEIVAVLGKYKFIIKFILRFSLLHETFLAQQKARKREDRGSSMMGLKMFPDTRFAYAFLMIHSVFVNWFVVSNLPQTQEFKLLKRHATTKQKPDFRPFEDLVGSSETMRQGEAAVGVLRPISNLPRLTPWPSVSRIAGLETGARLVFGMMCTASPTTLTSTRVASSNTHLRIR